MAHRIVASSSHIASVRFEVGFLIIWASSITGGSLTAAQEIS